MCIALCVSQLPWLKRSIFSAICGKQSVRNFSVSAEALTSPMRHSQRCLREQEGPKRLCLRSGTQKSGFTQRERAVLAAIQSRELFDRCDVLCQKGMQLLQQVQLQAFLDYLDFQAGTRSVQTRTCSLRHNPGQKKERKAKHRLRPNGAAVAHASRWSSSLRVMPRTRRMLLAIGAPRAKYNVIREGSCRPSSIKIAPALLSLETPLF